MNLIFSAISTLVPNLVVNFPKTVVTSKFLMYRGYAELLGLGLDYLAKEIDLRSELRRWIVDSLFCMGVMKTGICTSQDLISFGDNEHVDAGQPYAQVVDFDDFILDPAARRIEVRCLEHGALLSALPDRCFDVVVFDPMFRRARAQAPAFDVVRRFADPRPLEAAVLEQARRVARRWVVVKDGAPGWDLARLGLTPLPSKRGARRLYARLPPISDGS